jgi:hypothetical protein
VQQKQPKMPLRTCPSVKWVDIVSRLERACTTFLENDAALLRVDANERSMTHRLAQYLQCEFPGLNVDCEYNRKGKTPKRLRGHVDQAITAPDTKGTTVFPDIIVHRRGAQCNLLVIEAKKYPYTEDELNYDKRKLQAYCDELRYEYGVLVLFYVGEKYGIACKRPQANGPDICEFALGECVDDRVPI